MADNVIKFRKIEKKPEKKPDPKPAAGPRWPAWLPWVVIVAAAIAFTLLQQSGLFGG